MSKYFIINQYGGINMHGAPTPVGDLKSNKQKTVAYVAPNVDVDGATKGKIPNLGIKQLQHVQAQRTDLAPKYIPPTKKPEPKKPIPVIYKGPCECSEFEKMVKGGLIIFTTAIGLMCLVISIIMLINRAKSMFNGNVDFL